MTRGEDVRAVAGLMAATICAGRHGGPSGKEFLATAREMEEYVRTGGILRHDEEESE